ncbi:MAG: hypothetical protein ACXWR1_11850 [Bdellovibrionota bacterium]
MRLSFLAFLLTGLFSAAGGADAAGCRAFHFFTYLNSIKFEMQVRGCDSFHWLEDRTDADYLPNNQRWTEELDIPTDGTSFDNKSFGKGAFSYENGVLVRLTGDGVKYYYSLEKGDVCNYYQDPDTDNIVWSRFPPSDSRHRTECNHISGRLM